MSDDARSDKFLEHFQARSARPTSHNNKAPIQVFIVQDDNTGLKESMNSGHKWVHVGTSPQLSAVDKMQARRRFQTFMSDN